jgi:hypothetical protein
MEEYFKIIRQALSENREKVETYYEAHHIVPRSFKKQSSTVLLTPEEHYRCHKLLAEHFRHHSIYGKKMLWAFHRMSYDGRHQLTEEQFGEARRILQTLWKADKTDTHKENIRKTRAGKKTIVHPESNEIKYVLSVELQEWINQGWENTNYRKGSCFSQDHKDKLSVVAKARFTGRTGLSAQAAKGPYTVEFEDGKKFTEGSYSQLSKAVNIPLVTLQNRYVHKKGQMLKGWAIS